MAATRPNRHRCTTLHTCTHTIPILRTVCVCIILIRLSAVFLVCELRGHHAPTRRTKTWRKLAPAPIIHVQPPAVCRSFRRCSRALSLSGIGNANRRWCSSPPPSGSHSAVPPARSAPAASSPPSSGGGGRAFAIAADAAADADADAAGGRGPGLLRQRTRRRRRFHWQQQRWGRGSSCCRRQLANLSVALPAVPAAPALLAASSESDEQ